MFKNVGRRNKIKGTTNNLAYKKYLQTKIIDNDCEYAEEPLPKDKSEKKTLPIFGNNLYHT
jgi:hypothetical protein